jgi:glycosyltransferase involved in cell wall biosynthesis
MKKQKIIHIIDTLELGGVQNLLISLISALKKDFDFEIIGFDIEDAKNEFLTAGAKKVTVLEISPFKTGFKYPQNIFKINRKLLKILQESKPNIVQTHLIGADIWGRLAAIKARVPKIIQTVHSAEKFRNNFFSAKGLKTLFFDKYLEKKTFKIIAVSKEIKNLLINQGIPDSKIKVIYPPIDTLKFAPNTSIRKKTRSELKVINNYIVGSVGRLSKLKAYDVLIKSFQEFSKIAPESKLIIIGDGEEKTNLLKYIKGNNLEKQVKLLGWRNDIDKLINVFDQFVLTSRLEGMPLVVSEAAANAKPIISTNAGGVKELIQNNKTGFVVEIDNQKALIEKMKYLYQNPKISKQIAKNARNASKMQDISKIALEYKKIYNHKHE